MIKKQFHDAIFFIFVSVNAKKHRTVMHQLGYHHRLGECLAAMLADAGFQ